MASKCGFRLLSGFESTDTKFKMPTNATNATPHRRAYLIHSELIHTVVAAYPRHGWSECFAGVIEEELKLKPWCHSTTFEVPGYKSGEPSQMATHVRGNDVMRPYE